VIPHREAAEVGGAPVRMRGRRHSGEVEARARERR
jgi:hypothetical protein